MVDRLGNLDPYHGESFLRLIGHLKASENLHRQTLGVIWWLIHIAQEDCGPEESLRGITECLVSALGFENCSMLKYDAERHGLFLICATGICDLFEESNNYQFNKGLFIDQGNSIAWKVFESKEPIFIEDTLSEDIPHLSRTKVKIRSMACLPLGGQGVINLSASRVRSFNVAQRRDLVIIAELIAYFMRTFGAKRAVGASCWGGTRELESKTMMGFLGKPSSNEVFESFSSIIHGRQWGIALIDSEGMIVSVNDALCNILRTTAKGLFQSSYERLFKNHLDIEKISNAIQTVRSVQIDMSLLRAANGENIPVTVFYQPLSKNAQGLSGLLVFWDFEVQKRLFEGMVNIEKMKLVGLMAKGLASELEELFPSLLGDLDKLEHNLLDELLKERLYRIRHALSDGAKIVERFAGYLDGGEEKRRLDVTALSALVWQVVDSFRPRIKELREKKGVIIDFEVKVDGAGEVLVESDDIRALLFNVFWNTIHAMADGGTVVVNSRIDDRELKIEVSGKGALIPWRELYGVFRKDDVNTAFSGLSVSKWISRKWGGEITLEREKGKGIKFSIWLPVESGIEIIKPAGEEGHMVESVSSHERLKVLIVDDEQMIVELLTTLLSGLGHDVTGFVDPLKALEVFETGEYDLVITDLGMPDVSGFELAKFVKEKDSSTKVVLITGWGADYEKRDLSDRGVDGVLGKPFKLEELKKLIKELFE